MIPEEEIRRLTEIAKCADTGDEWFAGPLQPVDEYGTPGSVSIGTFDIAAKFGGRADYDPATFNHHHEECVAEAYGGNFDPVAVATHLVAFSPPRVLELLAEVQSLQQQVLSLDEKDGLTFYQDGWQVVLTRKTSE